MWTQCEQVDTHTASTLPKQCDIVSIAIKCADVLLDPMECGCLVPKPNIIVAEKILIGKRNLNAQREKYENFKLLV